MEWPTRECGNTASVQACNLRPPWYQSLSFFDKRYKFIIKLLQNILPFLLEEIDLHGKQNM
jgi:hypothetical protein